MKGRLPGVARVCVLLAGMVTRTAGAAEPAGPRATEISYSYDFLKHTLARPIARQLDLGRAVRRLGGNPRQAANVDSADQVRLPSTWWTPRLGFRPVTVEQMLLGPGPGTGPAPGRLVVVRAKSQGVTPGFFVTDSAGAGFLLKFDPPELAEMATGADAVAANLYWAAGYNVADNAVYTFAAEDLELSGEATLVDAAGNRRSMDRDDLMRMLERVPRGPDGRYRSLASRLLPGRPLGPFEYEGRRHDDPEDLIPHQHRRELRGLWVIAAWTNHVDVRGPNSLDMWTTENGRSFVRHHLIDFGSCLGSGAIVKRDYLSGTEYILDYGVIVRQIGTLGLRPFPWESAVDPGLPSIGFIDSDTFDPGNWRPEYPNPAFDERTERDIRWGARIVAAFTDEHIHAAVARGHYSDPRAAAYLARVLIERRDMIVRRWLPDAAPTGNRP
jgi:hypothetical protein